MSQPAPLYVVGSATQATAVLRRLARAGWRTREGFAVTETGWDVAGQRLVLFGRVSDVDTARLAVLAAARGAGVVAIADPDAEVGRALAADLARIGPVRHDPDDEPDPAEGSGTTGDGGPPLSPEQRALLDRLANGETIVSARRGSRSA